MATIQNRSRFRVTVQNKDDATREFTFDRVDAVEAYVAELRRDHRKPRVKQLADCFEVRIRQKGYPSICITLGSEAEAETFVAKVDEERSRGLFIDYTKAHQITLAELLTRFLREESSTRRSFDLESYKIEGWLEDSGPAGQALLELYRDDLRQRGKTVRPAKFKMRNSVTHIEWIHKRLTEVTAEDIETFLRDRLEDVAPSTVDRELDILSAVFKVATKVWGYRLNVNPMDAVRRPKYFNERDRRLVGDEEQRLLAAARAEDHARCSEEYLQRLIDRAVDGTTFPNSSARKKVRAEFSHQLRAEAATTCQVVPLMEAFVQFQLMTAARRGESLDLTWTRVDFDAQTAFLPLTKNGRPRKLSLRSDLLDLLERLPQTSARVFPTTTDQLAGAWARMCAAADIADLHIHDLRHEGISRVAELGDGTSGSGFGLVELQAFSGHRDTRSLLRYAHLCSSRMAVRLDDAFAEAPLHKGRRRLDKTSEVKVSELTTNAGTAPDDVIADSRTNSPALLAPPSPETVAPDECRATTTATIGDASRTTLTSAPATTEPLPANVIPFPSRRKIALG